MVLPAFPYMPKSRNRNITAIFPNFNDAHMIRLFCRLSPIDNTGVVINSVERERWTRKFSVFPSYKDG